MDNPMPPPSPPIARQSKQKPTVNGASMSASHTQPGIITSRRTAKSALPQIKPSLNTDADSEAVVPVQKNTLLAKDAAPAKSKVPPTKHQAAQNIPKDRTYVQAVKSNARAVETTLVPAVGLSGQPIGYKARRLSKPAAQSSGYRKPGDVMEVQANPHSRPSVPAASSKSKAGASRPDDSVTEDNSPGVPSDSVTEDDSQAIEFVPKVAESETEDSDQPPPKKKSKVDQKDIKGKAKEGGKAETARQGGRVKIVESSEVEVVEEKTDQPVEKVFPVKKRSAVKTAAVDRSSDQKPKDKIRNSKGTAGVSNTYLKPNFSGTNGVQNWTASVPQGTKPSSEQTNSTPSLTNSRSNVSRATSATRPPASVVSRASALSNGIQISGADEDNLMENGAISDRDETQGEEYEAKKKSPIKDGTRLTSAHKVKVEPGIPASIPAATKVTRLANQKLPDRFKEGTLWKSVIIPTMIMWAGTQSQIFRISGEKIAKVLEVVCCFHFDDPSITFDPKGSVVARVLQHLMDQFRGPMGSSAVAILLAYLASCPELRDSDEKRVEWCEMMLDDYRFIYASTDGPTQRRWKRPFQSGLIIQCLASYISAIKRVPWLLGMYPNSEDPNTPRPEPRPALALATAAVERALQYVVEGRITLATIEAEKSKEGYLITADINPNTMKHAASSVAFSDELWGADVQDYLISIKGLRKSTMGVIIEEARKFSRLTRTHEEDDEPVRGGVKSARARIPLNYDADSDEEDDESQQAVDEQSDDATNEHGMQVHYSDNNQDLGIGDDNDESISFEDVEMDFDDGHAQYSN